MPFSAGTSIARQARAFIVVKGAQLAPTECSVHLSMHQSSDTFYAKVPLDNDAGLDETFWADTAPIEITVTGTNDVAAMSPVQLIVGQADEPQIDFARRIVEVRGSDLTAALIDQKTSKQWVNRSNKSIIQELAGNAGLTVQFGGDSDNAGLQFDQDYNEISDLDSSWNMIVECAKRLGCIAFVKGKTLFIQPIDAAPSSVYAFTYDRPTDETIAAGNFVQLYCARNLRLAKDASIKSASWQHKRGAAVKSEFESKGRSTSADKLIYQFRAPNLTKEQQDRISRSHLRETLAHERVVTLNGMPGDVAVIPPIGFSLSGTSTAFDQTYAIAEVVHRFGFDAGYQMDITANGQDASRGDPEQLA